MPYTFNPFTGDFDFFKAPSKLLGFYTTYCCGLLGDLDAACYHAIDCATIADIATLRQNLDFGTLEFI